MCTRETATSLSLPLLALAAIACAPPSAGPTPADGETESSTFDGSDAGTSGGSNPTSGAEPQTGGGDGASTTGGPPPPPEFGPWAPAAAGPLDVQLGPLHTVYEPPSDFDLGSFPVAVGVPRLDGTPGTRAIVSFSENADESNATIVRRVMATTDLGNSYDTIDHRAEMTNTAVLADQSMLSVGFVPVWGSGDSSAALSLARSTDGGLSWQDSEGTFFGGGKRGQIRGLRFHRGLLEVPSGPESGTLLTAFYGHLGPGPIGDIGSVELAASQDDGLTWNRWGTIIAKRHPSDPDETTFEYAADGSMVAVTRSVMPSETGATQNPLLLCRSQDDGQTWSEPQPVVLSLDGQPAAPIVAVDPHLHRLPNGALLLAAGRPDNWIALSRDSGETWTDATTTYVNYPANGSRFHGSSGYQAIVSVASHRALLFGDNCANSWGCPASDSGWVVDGEYRIWARTLDVVPADPGRMDLLAALEAQDVTVTTDLVADHEALGSQALFDGNLSPGARLTGSGETLIEFAQPQSVTRLALATAPGSAAAHVALFDGESWVDPQITTAPGGDRGLQAFEPPAPRQVQAMRITFDDEGRVGVLSELELYTTTNSFENETLGQPPRAATEATMAAVERLDPQQPAQAIRLHDTADDAIAQIAFAVPEGTGPMSFRMRASALPGGLLFGLADADGSILHLTIDADGAIRRYDWDAETWSPVAPASTVDPFAWMQIALDARGALTIDGLSIDLGTPTLVGTPESLYVTSTGTLPVGVDLWIDDVTF